MPGSMGLRSAANPGLVPGIEGLGLPHTRREFACTHPGRTTPIVLLRTPSSDSKKSIQPNYCPHWEYSTLPVSSCLGRTTAKGCGFNRWTRQAATGPIVACQKGPKSTHCSRSLTTANGRLLSFAKGSFWPRLCKNVFDRNRWLDSTQKLRSYANFRSAELPSASNPRAPLCCSRTASKTR